MENTKYFRSYHFPFSKGSTSDDRISRDYSFLENREVIITEKLDGENCLDQDTLLITSDDGFCDTYKNGVKTKNRLLVFTPEQVKKINLAIEKVEKNED